MLSSLSAIEPYKAAQRQKPVGHQQIFTLPSWPASATVLIPARHASASHPASSPFEKVEAVIENMYAVAIDTSLPRQSASRSGRSTIGGPGRPLAERPRAGPTQKKANTITLGGVMLQDELCRACLAGGQPSGRHDVEGWAMSRRRVDLASHPLCPPPQPSNAQSSSGRPKRLATLCMWPLTAGRGRGSHGARRGRTSAKRMSGLAPSIRVAQFNRPPENDFSG